MPSDSAVSVETSVAFAERFIASKVPEAIIYIPLGCIIIAVNKAHGRVPGIRPFDGSPLELAGFVRATKQRLIAAGRPSDKDHCYCQHEGFVDVLALSDCSLVKLSKLAEQSRTGIARRQDYLSVGQNGTRDYGVHGVLGRCIEHDVLAVVPGKSFSTIKVWGRSKEYTELPKVGLCAQFKDGPPQITKLPPDAQPYVTFLDRLQQVEKVLNGHNISCARESLHGIEQDFPLAEYATREVVGSILKPIANGNGRVPEEKIRKAKRELIYRGNSICDIFALEDAAEQNKRAIEEGLNAVTPPEAFEVIYKPGKYVNGADFTVFETSRGLIDQFLLLGHLTPAELRDLSSTDSCALETLEAGGMVGRDKKRNAFLTMKGLDALKTSTRKQHLTADRVARAVASRDGLTPLEESWGVVQSPPEDGRQAVRMSRNGVEEVRLFAAGRLDRIGRSAVGSRVVYRYYETDEGALSVLDPADVSDTVAQPKTLVQIKNR